MPAPVHCLLVYRYIHEILVELHDNCLVVLDVVVEEQAQLAGPVAPLWHFLTEIIFEVVHLNCLQ